MKGKALALGLLAMLLGTSVASGLASGEKVLEAHAAEGDEPSSSRTYEFYIPSDLGLLASGNLYLYAWEEGGTYTNAQWPGLAEDISYNEETSVATVTVRSADVSHIIINDGSSAQTENIWLPGHIDNLEITFGGDVFDQGSEPRWAIREGAGNYEYYLQAPSAAEAYGPDRFRFWLDRGADESGYYIYTYHGDDGLTHRVFPTGYQPKNEGSAYLAYYDIPMEAYGKDYSIAWTDDKMGTVLNTEVHQWAGIDNAKLHGVAKEESAMTLSEKTLSEHEISASFFGQHVLSAYFSCLPLEANGYLAASELRKNWVTPDDATWYVEGNLDEVAIDDYAVSPTPVEDYEEYYSLAEKSYETNAWEKLTAMLALEGSHSGSDAGVVRPFLDDSGNVAAIVALALVSVSALGIFVLLFRKRKTC